MDSIAHSFQHPVDLSMGSESFFGGLPTEVGLLTSLGEYRGYRTVGKPHVEAICFSWTDEPFCASTLFASIPISSGSIPRSRHLFPYTPYRSGVVDELEYVQYLTPFTGYGLNIQFVSPSPSSLFVHTDTLDFSWNPLNNVFPSVVLSLSKLSKLTRGFFLGLLFEFANFSNPINVHRTYLVQLTMFALFDFSMISKPFSE